MLGGGAPSAGGPCPGGSAAGALGAGAPAAGGLAPGVAPLRIGPIEVDTPVELAPMAGVTNASFRRLCRRYGESALPAPLRPPAADGPITTPDGALAAPAGLDKLVANNSRHRVNPTVGYPLWYELLNFHFDKVFPMEYF